MYYLGSISYIGTAMDDGLLDRNNIFFLHRSRATSEYLEK